QTDIYGLGATLQTLLTGEDPLEIRQHGLPPARAKRIPQTLQDALIHMQARDATKRPRNVAEVKKTLQEIKAQSPIEKIKAAATFTRELISETSMFAYMALILLVLINIAAFVGMVWQPLWIISLLTVLSFTALSGIFKLHEASLESQTRLSTGEKISIVWKQLATSLSVALLISMLLYYFFYMLSLFNLSPDDTYIETNLITLGIIAGSCIVVCLFWLLKWLAAILAAHKRASQRRPEILLQQKIRHHH
ncbi:MAG TPA: ComEC/Rec2 family competence protein, partial [Ktedonobacteraceae bacterium]|nr:ComEC/Rec2 family competence protein [Ktedonobacteraceae bacterium]